MFVGKKFEVCCYYCQDETICKIIKEEIKEDEWAIILTCLNCGRTFKRRVVGICHHCNAPFIEENQIELQGRNRTLYMCPICADIFLE